MATEKPTYHHGDLRAVLVARARDQVEKDGPAKLSLRKLAADAGVSHNAPYMHFASKERLLEAVGASGFSLLSAAIGDAGGREPLTAQDWRPRVKAGFMAYIAFAQARPRLYALMHAPSSAAPDDTPAAAIAGQETLGRLATTLAKGQVLGHVKPGDTQAMALWVWTTLHGLAALTAYDRRVFGGQTPDTVAQTVLDQLLAGLAP